MITHLDLQGNSRIGAEGLRELASMLCDNNSLAGVNLSGIQTHF